MREKGGDMDRNRESLLYLWSGLEGEQALAPPMMQGENQEKQKAHPSDTGLETSGGS